MKNKLKKLLKSRILNTKNNRIYLQDKELVDSLFTPGDAISFTFDNKTKTLNIVPSDEGSVTVSKRDRGQWINPVIDIRKKEILEGFNGCEKVEVTIYNDEIVVKGYTEIQSNELTDTNELINTKYSKVVSLKDKLYKVEQVVLSNRELDVFAKKVSGEDFISNHMSFTEHAHSIYNRVQENISQTTATYKEKFIDKTKKALKVISLCSGIGVLDKGFKDAGFDIVYAADIEKNVIDTYKKNLGDHIVNVDMNNINIEDLPEAPVLTVGSPCQDFSNANRVTGKILDSPKNLLVRKVIDIATNLKGLKVCCIENVPQLLTKGKAFVEELKERMSDFEITINKVNSYDYGSAQKRERAIIICSKIGKIELNPPNFVALQTVRDAFRGLSDSVPNQLDFTRPKEETIERMKHIPPGGNFRDIPANLRSRGVHSNSYRRLELDKPSITITNVRKSNILHPTENRILSIRECARLFDLDDSFEFIGSLSAMQQAIANAVPYKLALSIANSIRDAFFRYDLQY